MGHCVRAPRHPLLRDLRRPVDRIPSARAARRAERAGRGHHRHPPGEPGRGVGRERVLDRALLADRPRRLASASGSSSSRRRSRARRLTVDEYYGWIFENSVPGSARGGGRRGARRRSSTCVATVPSRSPREVGQLYEQPVPDDELDDVRGGSLRAGSTRGHRAAADRSNMRRSAHPDRPTRKAAAGSACAWTARFCKGFPTPSGKLEFYSTHPRRLGLAGVRHPDLHQEPRPPGEHGSTTRCPDLDVPAAGPDPHPQRQRQVARRDRPHQPALAAPDATPSDWASRDR